MSNYLISKEVIDNLNIKAKENKFQLKHEKFIVRLKETFNDEYTALGKFVNTNTKILMKHNTCGHEWSPSPNNLFGGRSKCPRCSGKVKYSTESFQQKVNEVSNGEYLLISKYVNMETKVTLKHTVCDFEWYTNPHDFLASSTRCSRCAKRERYTDKAFKKKLKDITNDMYESLEPYVNNRVGIRFVHKVCGKSFTVPPTNFLSGIYNCLSCNNTFSSGERKIYDFLQENEIDFKKQFTFDDCFDIKLLRFDFALLGRNSKAKGVIEYDGEQHFKPVEFFGGEEKFERIKRRDSIKNEYCKINNIPLIRIPYWEFNRIEELINDFITDKI